MDGCRIALIVKNLPRDPVIFDGIPLIFDGMTRRFFTGSRGFSQDLVQKATGSRKWVWHVLTGFLAKRRDPVKLFTG